VVKRCLTGESRSRSTGRMVSPLGQVLTFLRKASSSILRSMVLGGVARVDDDAIGGAAAPGVWPPARPRPPTRQRANKRSDEETRSHPVH